MASATAAAAAPAAGVGKGHVRSYHKSHIVQIHCHPLHLFQQPGIHAEGIASLFLGLVLFVRLIQSQGQTGTASTGRHIYPDGLLLFAGKKSIKLLAGTFCQCYHVLYPPNRLWLLLDRYKPPTCQSGLFFGRKKHKKHTLL